MMTAMTESRQGRFSGSASDLELLARVASAEPEALAELYERYGVQLLAYLRRLAGGDQGLAEEALQETFLAVWRSADSYQERSAVRTWIYAIARNQALSQLRRHRPELVVLEDSVERELADSAPGPERQALARSELAEIGAVLERINPVYREVLGLVFVDELTYPEVAEVLDVSVGTVKSRVFHARAALTRALDGRADADA